MHHITRTSCLLWVCVIVACFDWDLPSAEVDGDADADGDSHTDGDADLAPDGDTDPDIDADLDDDGVADSDVDVDSGSDADAEICVDPVCDLRPQCGCDDGEACIIHDSFSRECLPTDSIPHGEVCELGDESRAPCEPGALCTRYSEDEIGICRQFCEVQSDCRSLGFGSACGSNFGDRTDIGICSRSCDPTSESPVCPGETACAFVSLEGATGTECFGAIGPGLHGDPCESTDPPTGCQPGHICLFEGNPHCYRICMLPDGTQCLPGQECRDTTPSVIVNGLHYGMCV